jgi:hypothetical protein
MANSKVTSIPRMNNAVHAALAERQEAVDQAHAVAELLLARFNAMIQGADGPDDGQVMSALQVIVDRLRTCDCLADAVKLENDGRKILSVGQEVANG